MLPQRGAPCPRRRRLPPDAPPPPSLGLFVQRGATLIRWRVRGLHHPNPFFDARGAPRARPQPLLRS
jgi:hypothetical protein